MNEKRMTTCVSTGDVSLPPAQGAGWGVRIGGDEGIVAKTSNLGDGNRLAKRFDGTKIAKKVGQT